MLMEGASIDWSAIYMRTVFDAGPFVAGFTVALFAFSQASTRFFADSFVDRHSPSGVARVLLATMAVGVLLVFFSPAPSCRCWALPCWASQQCDLSAGDLGGRPANGPLRGNQCRGAVADFLRRLPARPTAARLRLRPLGHPFGLRHRHPVHRAQPADRRVTRA